jgi:SIR2-like domain
MRWVKDGPNIPLELIRAAEDGRLVFFCGAGISQRAGLPGFKGLVEAVYEKLQRKRSLFPIEEKAFQECNYDQVFANLESSIKNSNLVREKVAEVLQVREGADTGTHQALLRLSTDAQGICRLVTTNYDLGFFLHKPASTRIDAAPRLPVPRPGRWNSIVHLHGFLQECGKDWEELILSSADFGAAYLVDGWATRFLREIFRHFIVLFVGYGVNDVVVRYMLQALAVSFAEQGDRPRAFAFAEVEDDAESTILTWRAKGIEPILYTKSDNSHEVLHQSLRVWAEKASRGLMGRRSIAAEYLGQSAPVERNEIVDQVLWALNDGSGATAKFIAEQPASPSPRHWLAILDGADFLSLDGVPLVDNGRSGLHSEPIQSVTWGLAQWLCQHLSEADVLDWALTNI